MKRGILAILTVLLLVLTVTQIESSVAVLAILATFAAIVYYLLRIKNAELLDAAEKLSAAEEFRKKDANIRETRDRLAHIISTSPLVFVILQGDLVVDCNIYMSENFGMRPGDDLRSYYAEPGALDKLFSLSEKYGLITNEIILLRMPQGDPHRFLANFSSINFGDELMHILWAIDIEESELQKDHLRITRESLQTVLDTLPVPLRISAASDESIIYANNTFSELFEFDSPEDAYGRSLESMLPILQNDGTYSHTKIQQFANVTKTKAIEIDYLTAKSSIIETRSILSPIYYNGIHATLGIIQDLAEENERQMLHENLQRIMDVMPLAVRILEVSTGKFLYANNKCVEMFECRSFEEMQGVPIYKFLPEYQSDGTHSKNKMAELLHQNANMSMEFEYLTQNGNILDTHISTFKVNYMRRRAQVGVIRDLAEEKIHQQMLLNAAEKEKEANQLKSKFLVNMSHEIRTPMNAIIGLTEIELRKRQQTETREVFRKISDSAKNLLEIINDILDLSKIEANKMDLLIDEYELEDIVNSALLVASPRLEGKTVEFVLKMSPDLPRYVMCDRARVWQILKNFLDNSAKYTNEGKITLNVRLDTPQSTRDIACIVFVITDTGIGMNEAQLRKIFMPYEQFYNEAQKRYSGTGLGMAISKQMCEIMNGELKISSVQGTGTTIHITIPFRRSGNSDTLKDKLRSEALDGARILIVDDDDVSLNIMTALLECNDTSCITADNGSDAMNIINEYTAANKAFDAILMDCDMENINGLDMAKWIHDTRLNTPVLLIAAANRRLLLEEQLSDCVYEAILEKPLIPSQFITKVSEALGQTAQTHVDEVYTTFDDVRVLICEDNHLNQEVATGIFNYFGISPVMAQNGQRGLELLNESEPFDIIFMDLQMPVMDGYETTKRIRADARFDDVPIISLTADAMPEIAVKCLEVGMNDHISKPLRFDRVHDILLKWLPESKRAGNAKAGDGSVLMLFGGDKRAYEQALREFAQSLPVRWQSYDDAVSDPAQTMLYIHNLKGVSGNLSETGVYQSAIAFENSLRKSAPDRQAYERLVEQCIGARKRILARQQDYGPVEAGTAEELNELLNELCLGLQDYDPMVCSDTIKRLRQKDWADADEGLEQLFELAGNYEFDEALTALEGIQAAGAIPKSDSERTTGGGENIERDNIDC